MRDPDDKREFAEVLRVTMDIYGKDCSVPVMKMWWMALLEYAIEDVRIGFSRYIKSADSGTFPPKPADIIRMIEGSGQDRGMLAWSKVADAFGRVGAYRSVAFDDPAIHRVIADMGGWVELCKGTEEEQPYKANEFAKRYRAYCESGGPNDYPSYFVGITEAENAARGFKTEPPVMIGDAEKCKQVMQIGSANSALKISHISAYLGAAA